VLGSYRFDDYRSPGVESADKADTRLTIVVPEASNHRVSYERDWKAVAQAVNQARDLVNQPPNIKTPAWYAQQILSLVQSIDSIEATVLDEAEMQARGMGALLGVAAGSVNPPRMLVLRYQGSSASARPVAFLGKGITFDSGGLTLKPWNSMQRQKVDMAGAATVTAVLIAAAQRAAPVNLIAVLPLAENMPSGSAQRPGDVRRTMCGHTVEIIDTDAEGRLVLADALCFLAATSEPRVIIDLATLTGSSRRAFGDVYAAVLGNDDNLIAQLLDSGRESGELLWRLPMHPRYAAAMASSIADIRNVSTIEFAGASTAAHFLEKFVPPATPWAHIDFPGMVLAETAHDLGPIGATGFGVLLLDQWLRNLQGSDDRQWEHRSQGESQ
jgi:leucyl aminopeptidase